MPLSATQLRADIDRVLDECLRTGEAVEIVHNGRVLRIVPDRPQVSLESLPRRADVIVGDPDDLVHVDWTDEWLT